MPDKSSKILLINNSELLNDFIKDCFKRFDIELIISKTLFDGMVKMKNEIPDLIIIDFQLTFNNQIDFFKEKKDYKTVSDIPVICLSSKVDMNAIIQAGKNKVYKFFEKPVKQEALLKAAGEILKIDFKYDDTPSIMEVSLNSDILFIEIGIGINYERLNSLKYKIIELMRLYKIKKVKSLVMFNDVEYTEEKLYSLMETILDSTLCPQDLIKILSADKNIKPVLNLRKNLSKIDVFSDLSQAMDSIGNIDIDNIINTPKNDNKGELSLDDEEIKSAFLNKPTIALVDDDEFIIDLVEASLSSLNVNVKKFTNGNNLIELLEKNSTIDLVFLDLMMPVISGFEILEKLNSKNIKVPIIIFSSLSQKETVMKALKYGVKSYIVKPIDPELIINKASEILKSDF